jgi:hypothetical protein
MLGNRNKMQQVLAKTHAKTHVYYKTLCFMMQNQKIANGLRWHSLAWVS